MVANATLEKLQEQRGEGIEKMRDLVELCADSGFSDEQRDELKQLQAKDKDVEERIEALKSVPVVETAGRAAEPDRLSIKVKKPNFEDDPKKGFKAPREFLLSVMDAYKSGKIEDERLNSCQSLAAGSDEQSTFADPYGGFLIPEGFSPNLLSVGAETDPTAGRTMNIPMTTPSLSIPARVDKNHSTSVSGGLTMVD